MFSLTGDQELFEATTARFLESHYPCSRTHEWAAKECLFDAALWRQGAELGWTSLLVPEPYGGGSISGNGLLELAALAQLFGRHAAPGALTATNVVAAALGWWGSSEQRAGPLAELIAGRATAAWCAAVLIDPWATGDTPPITATTVGDDVVLNGTVGCVEGAGDATYLLVSAQENHTHTYYLVAASSPGVVTAPLAGLDLTRRFWRVSLSDVAVPATAVVGPLGAATTGDDLLTDIVAALHAADIVGAMTRCVDMTLPWLQERYSFGRPLASYQEIKHRMADMRTTLQACAAASEAAARAVGQNGPDAGLWASAAMAYVGEHGPEVIQDCIQLHGGIGVTAEHALHVLLRRAVVSANVVGTPADFTQRLVGLIDTPPQHGRHDW